MSDPVPDRPAAEGQDPATRAVPPAYGTHRSPDAADAAAPGESGESPALPSAGEGPRYGRVTRFGTPAASPPAGARPQPVPGSPPPAPGPPVAAPAAPGLPASDLPTPPAPGAPVPPAAPWPPDVHGSPPYAPVPGSSWGPADPSTARGPGPLGPPPGWPASPSPRGDYAPWIRRVLGLLVDHLPSYVASTLLLVSYVPLYAGLLHGDFTARPSWGLYTAGVLLSLASLGWTVWNRWVLAGRTGQSVGKHLTRLWLVGEVDGRPVGVLTAFLRDLLHVLDGFGHVGYLWPLWDERHQTLADKVAQTVVVTSPVPPLGEHDRGRPA